MANEAEVFGLPQVLIDFKTKGTTAIKRSARGIVAMILKNEETDVSKYYKINDVSDIPDEGLTAENVDLIKKCLLGTPLRILVYTLPKEDISEPTQKLAGILAKLESVKWNYLCYPNSTEQEQQDIVSWIKSERGNKRKTFKAVVAILAGLALDRSATYFKLTEVEEVEQYEDIDSLIDKGQLLLFDEQDGDGVKIARACNSLTTFTTDKGEDFRYIKIMEAVDMITDDIRDTFKKYYVGKVINDYDHKMLFITAILVYFDEIKGNVLDRDGNNTVDIDEQYQANYAKLYGEDTSTMTAMQIRQYNTGTNVVLAGSVKPVNAMEDLKIVFAM